MCSYWTTRKGRGKYLVYALFCHGLPRLISRLPNGSYLPTGETTYLSALRILSGGILYLYRYDLQKLIKGKTHKALGVLITGYAVLFFWNHLYSHQIYVAVLLFLCSIYAVTHEGKGILNNRVVSFLSGISFEIYLCHMMFLRAVGLLHLERHICDRNILTIITYGLVIALSIVFSVTYKKIERRIIHK